jgi:hypothetical protein
VVTLPVGWVMEETSDDALRLSRDGYLLEYVEISHRQHAKAFPKLKKSASDAMLPSELAELSARV